jgi:hypothetical protein
MIMTTLLALWACGPTDGKGAGDTAAPLSPDDTGVSGEDTADTAGDTGGAADTAPPGDTGDTGDAEEDLDGDGYRGSEDCDDSDPGAWWSGPAYEGDVQGELIEDFCDGYCTRDIHGSLTVEGLNHYELFDLGCVTEVTRDVTLSQYGPTDLSYLRNLRAVGATLSIHDNAALTSLTGLENLTQLHRLYVMDNDLLASLEGLENLETVQAGLSISTNSALDDLGALAGLRSVGGMLGIQANGKLLHIDTFESLEEVGSLRIDNNHRLNSVSLGRLTTIAEDLEITGNEGLEAVIDLGNLEALPGTLFIEDNKKLADLSGLAGLRSAGAVVLANNYLLTDLQGLRNLETLTGRDGGDCLEVDRNASLVDLSDLSALRSVGCDLSIQENLSLTQIGLEALETISGNLEVLSNPLLGSLAGLEGLGTIGSDLTIQDNTVLSSVSALRNLDAVGGDVSIVDNPALPTQDAQQLVEDIGTIGGEVVVSGNAE